jgi:hypothetical protein
MAWDHQSVYEELLRRMPHEDNRHLQEPYAFLYVPQEAPDGHRCALLYPTDSKSYRRYPVHLNDSVDSWQPDAFLKIEPFIEYVQSPTRKEWSWYVVRPGKWNEFGEALGLGTGPAVHRPTRS